MDLFEKVKSFKSKVNESNSSDMDVLKFPTEQEAIEYYQEKGYSKVKGYQTESNYIVTKIEESRRINESKDSVKILAKIGEDVYNRLTKELDSLDDLDDINSVIKIQNKYIRMLISKCKQRGIDISEEDAFTMLEDTQGTKNLFVKRASRVLDESKSCYQKLNEKEVREIETDQGIFVHRSIPKLWDYFPNTGKTGYSVGSAEVFRQFKSGVQTINGQKLDDPEIKKLLLESRSSGSILNESAESSLYYDPDMKYSNDDIAAQISINYEGESNAITGYYKLIPFLKSVGDKEAIVNVREIISDEKNHQKILKELSMKYDGNIPVNAD